MPTPTTRPPDPVRAATLPPVRGLGDLSPLGLAPIDETHAEFLGCLGSLAASVDRAGPIAAPANGPTVLPSAGIAPASATVLAPVSAALLALQQHLQAHFALEERLMAESAFPAAACHCDEHAAVLRSVDAVLRRLSGGELSPVEHLLHQLETWFPAHADYLDAPLAHWIARRRLGGQPVVLHRRPDLRRPGPTPPDRRACLLG